jgi:predicted TIM-barrel fold metal-dependent hydrolase
VRVSTLLACAGTDEYVPPLLDDFQQEAIDRASETAGALARRIRRPLGDYGASRLGTAAGLRALNDAFGIRAYDVPPEACAEDDAADDAFAVGDLVVDLQTHFMADRPELWPRFANQVSIARDLAPDWWRGFDDLTSYDFAEYLRCVFLESDTAIAVLSAPPADDIGAHWLTNDELAATREMIDRLAGAGRMLNHTVVHPTEPGALERLEEWRDTLAPVAWKVYTLGRLVPPGRRGWNPESAWMLDDEEWGLPFLERVREVGVQTICTHKGLSGMVDNGSPRDVGPSARMFPDIDFVVYHSGFEGVAVDEGPYLAETADQGINRLVTTLAENNIGPGGNVYAELGTTWFAMVKRPVEAAHVIGKLLLAVGEDNVLWGTDSCFYGPTQPITDAFRAFQIPDALCEQFGYPKLTAQTKAKILGLNAARVYGIDADAARETFRHDDLAWTRAAIAEYRRDQPASSS